MGTTGRFAKNFFFFQTSCKKTPPPIVIGVEGGGRAKCSLRCWPGWRPPHPHQAEDIAQTAWLQCVQHAQRFFSLPEEKRLPWMVTLVKHAALTHLRTAGRTVPLDPEADLPAPEAGDPGDIIAILRSMPETYRTVLELRFLEELDSAEIARRTGLSVSAVDTRIHRGRKRLQEALRKEGYGRG